MRGVVSMLRRLVLDGKPDYFAVVFDAPGKTFRDALYADYKSNRKAMPDDLSLQVPALHDLVRASATAAYERKDDVRERSEFRVT